MIGTWWELDENTLGASKSNSQGYPILCNGIFPLLGSEWGNIYPIPWFMASAIAILLFHIQSTWCNQYPRPCLTFLFTHYHGEKGLTGNDGLVSKKLLIFCKYFTHTDPTNQGHYKSLSSLGLYQNVLTNSLQVSSGKI